MDKYNVLFDLIEIASKFETSSARKEKAEKLKQLLNEERRVKVRLRYLANSITKLLDELCKD